MSKKINVGIIGATGYTGSELVRILIHHPSVEIAVITADSRKGERFVDVHPQFRGIFDAPLVGIEEIDKHDLDVVFLALPHGVSMGFVKDYLDRNFKIIDLSGDFRLSSPSVYKTWYKKDHNFSEGFESAVFGLPELFRARIKKAHLVANPGCFPTSAILALAPLLKEGVVDKNHLIVDSKTGVTGAGNKAKPNTHFPVVNDNFTAYGIKTHRHTIEIQEVINSYSGEESSVLFTPHLLPVDRGILSTCYLKPTKEMTEQKLSMLFKNYYGNEPFVRLVDQVPSIKQVRGTNFADLFTTYDERTQTIITVSVIDNLVKGAAGQAVQNMNLMMGLSEDEGLTIVPIQP